MASNEGLCVTSPNYPSSYDNNEACRITMSGVMTLTATAFNTESGDDKLFICQDGSTCSPGTGRSSGFREMEYHGASGPSNVVTSGPLVP